MREIKFRVYLDEMYYQNKYNEYDTNLVGIDFLNKTVTFSEYADYEERPIVKYSFDENNILYKKGLKIMQYTGIKDKNGKEIYEGDIVFESSGKEYFKVVFEDGSFRLESEEYSLLLKNYAHICEVVGNIYENPELIIGGSK